MRSETYNNDLTMCEAYYHLMMMMMMMIIVTMIMIRMVLSVLLMIMVMFIRIKVQSTSFIPSRLKTCMYLPGCVLEASVYF